MEKTNPENICKIIILESNQRRIFHPKLHDNFAERVSTHKKSSSGIKKCLFGKADSDDTRRMLEEQYVLDQQRFFNKFGFDIDTIEHLERSKDDIKENIENDRNGQNIEVKTTSCDIFSGAVKTLGRKVLKARRKVTFSRAQARQSQQVITDFYQARKNSLQPLEKRQNQQQPASNMSSQNC